MKRDLKVCALLLMMLMLVLTMYTNVNAAEGGYDTIQMDIKPTKDTAWGDGNGSKARNDWWIYNDFKTLSSVILNVFVNNCSNSILFIFYVYFLNKLIR